MNDSIIVVVVMKESLFASFYIHCTLYNHHTMYNVAYNVRCTVHACCRFLSHSAALWLLLEDFIYPFMGPHTQSNHLKSSVS